MSMSMNLHERRDGSFTYFQPFLQMEKQDKKRMKGNKRTYRAQATLPTPDSLFLPRPFCSLSLGLTELPPFSRFYLSNRLIKKEKTNCSSLLQTLSKAQEINKLLSTLLSSSPRTASKKRNSPFASLLPPSFANFFFF